MRKPILFILLTAALVSSCTSKDTFSGVELYKYSFADMDENVMPISGWVAPTVMWNCNTLEQYQILKESGLNSIYGFYEQYGALLTVKNSDGTTSHLSGTDEMFKALDYAQQVGVKYFVRDSSIWNKNGEEFKTTFESRRYTDYSSFAGFHYSDEPRTHEQFLNIQKSYNKFKQYIPNKYAFYVNLNPIEIYSSSANEIEDYENYIQDYVDTVKPNFLSFDYYCPLGNFPNLKNEYFRQLYVFSEKAKENKLPFWAFALASGHKFSSGAFYRAPTKEDIFFQVNTVLAYGAKGLQYFCYQTPFSDTEKNGETYIGQGGSIVNEKGEKTEIFPYIKLMNQYVEFIDEILMNSTKIGMMACENRPSCYLFEDRIDSIREVSSLNSEDNVICSVFDYKGKTVLYLVNTSLYANSTFTVEFEGEQNFNVYPMTLEKETKKSANYADTLEPGKAVVLELL